MNIGNGTAGPESCRNAVLLLIFNRPDTTMEVLHAIKLARPPRLYVACDGPREGRAEEARTVRSLRAAVLDAIDWPCEVKTLFRDRNLGCKAAVSGAIGWFFDQEEQGIILEDDCLPSGSFFSFCDELLDKHATDVTVAGITGDYRRVNGGGGPDAYARVGYPLIWGWASWRRVWRLYDPAIKAWSGDTADIPRIAAKKRPVRDYLRDVFNAVKDGRLDTWDFQLNFMCHHLEMDFLHPYVNLVSNIGFASGATHTSDPNDPNAALPRGEVSFPLTGPLDDRSYEEWLDRKVFSQPALPMRALKRLQRWTRAITSGS